jgi:tetratricopeptide (TPR) repeat protein
MLRGLAVLACASLAALGCAAPLTGPAAGGAPWAELRSAHFTMRTDLEDAEARRVLGSIEDAYDVFKRVVFPSETDPNDRIDVTVFARERDYEAIAPPAANAYLDWSPPNDLEPVPMMVMHGALDDDKRRVLQHELTHFFVHQAFGGVPSWFDEGLAEYYSTVTVASGHAYVGLPRPDRHVNLVRAAPWDAGRNDEVWVPIQALPTFSRLVSLSPEAFYQRSSDSREAARIRTANYLGAWGLLHLLHEGPAEYQRRYAALADMLRHGKPFGLAWRAAFRGVGARTMEIDYGYHFSVPAKWHAVRYTPGPAAPPAELRPMRDAEVHLLWARMMRWSGAELERAARQLDEAAASERDAPEVLFWRAVFATSARRDYAEAVRGFDTALARKPDDPRLLLGLARALAAWEWAGHAPPPGRLARTVDALVKRATSPAQLDFVARYHLQRGRLAEAAPLAERAAKADPTCASCWDTWAQVAYRKGDVAEALAAQQRAIAMFGERRVDRGMIERLLRYAQAYEATVRGTEPADGE